jgi:hypothetical protein
MNKRASVGLAVSTVLAMAQLAISPEAWMQKLAGGFKGPADFCVVPQGGALTVVVPDLVQSQLRFIHLK